MSRTILLIDDDIASLKDLRTNLKLEKHRLTWEKDITKSIRLLTEGESPCLVIVDLFHEGTNRGFDIAEICERRQIPYIIITAYNTIELYEQMAIYNPQAYYTKPIDFASLKYTVAKLIDRSPITHSKEQLDGLYVRKKSVILKVMYKDILYFHGAGNYITLNTSDEKFVIRKSLKALIEELPAEFERVHRNYVVRLDKIQKVDLKNAQVMIHDHSLPLGRSFRKSLKNSIDEYSTFAAR